MTSALAAGLRALAEALPAGTAVPVPREVLLDLLNGSPPPISAESGRMLTAEEVAPILNTTVR